MLEERENGLYEINDDGSERLLEDYNDGYYHVFSDSCQYPNANLIVTFSRRGPGKTTGALLGAMLRGLRIMYIKRTIADVKMITNGGGAVDLSPWETVNRLKGTNYRAMSVKGVDGFAEVVQCDSENNPVANVLPIGYICALSAAGKIKGFDLSDKVDIMLVDEFVPNKGVIAKQAEGDQTLDILATLVRDRHKRGLKDIKLWLFSNCDYIACPITRTLCLLDDVYDMASLGESTYYNEDRRILLHHIKPDEYVETINYNMFNFMNNTDWYKRNIVGDFDEDFSNIIPSISFKNYKPVAKISYNGNVIHILHKSSDSSYYITYNYNNRVSTEIPHYDLNYENSIRLFYHSSIYTSILNSSMIEKVKYSSYSIYDLFRRYSAIFYNQLY